MQRSKEKSCECCAVYQVRGGAVITGTQKGREDMQVEGETEGHYVRIISNLTSLLFCQLYRSSKDFITLKNITSSLYVDCDEE